MSAGLSLSQLSLNVKMALLFSIFHVPDFNGVGARSLYKVAADVVINDDGIGKIIHGDFVADRGRLAVQEVRRKGSV